VGGVLSTPASGSDAAAAAAKWGTRPRIAAPASVAASGLTARRDHAPVELLWIGEKPSINWLELAASAGRHSEGAATAVHPMDLGGSQSCFGVSLNRRWMCDSYGALVFFDSIAAATLLLQLLNVERLALGVRRNCDLSGHDAFHCFCLGAKGLAACAKCRAGGEARLQASLDRARWDERW
jgi:hypothetical protein